MDAIEEQEIDWLWRDRIPRGRLTEFLGDPGVGKSHASQAIAADLSVGRAETGLSEGDILRLTDAMIDRKHRVIVPEGGRMKTQETAEQQPSQMAPLTDRALKIVDDILAERRSSKVVSIGGPLFTREDGHDITRDMISRGVKRAWKKAEIKKFVFHNYRNTALTDWAARGISADIAMQASGHTSVQMHKRYLDLQRHHIAKAFGLESGNTNGRQESPDEKTTAAN